MSTNPVCLQAKQLCEQAWKEHPNAKVIWCCHHTVELEPLVFPIQERIDYILNSKPERELVVRFDNLRPVVSMLPPTLNEQFEALYKIGTDWHNLYETLVKVTNTHYFSNNPAFTELQSRWDSLYSECRKLQSVLGAEIRVLHNKDVPNNTWDGESIFGPDGV